VADASDSPATGGAGIQRLWAGWRIPYIEEGGAPSIDRPDGMTLFESILHSGLPDEETYILWRSRHCFALLNAFPYTNGHLMVLPQRGVARLDQLTPDEFTELWVGVRDAVAALEAAYQPDGVNVGLNLGEGAGAGVPDHVHVHVLPRWTGDTNFTVTVAETKVLPEALDVSWSRVSGAWPAS
jgi:ATP adenylyltransferase